METTEKADLVDRQSSQDSAAPENKVELDLAREQKTRDILEACRWRSIAELRSLAESEGGFLTDSLRQKAWPILLGNSQIDDSDSSEPTPWRDLPRHKDEDQVQLDVNRAFIYYPSDQSDAQLEQHKADLSDLINEVLRRHPYLCYFQGYHDICQVFLLVLEPGRRAPLVARLSLLRIRDFMLPSLAPTTAQLRLIPEILNAADPNLRRHLGGVDPYYALAGTLTMYAHNIEAYRDIARLFDVLLAREPVFSVYLFAQIVLSRRDELFDTPADDTSMLHFILSKVPQTLDLEALITDTRTLFENHPPESLRRWRRISSSSCLKTAKSVEACSQQSLEDGRKCFEKQAKELRRQETRAKVFQTMWSYRRPARAIGLVIVVGVVAIYLRRNPGLIDSAATFFSRRSYH